MRWIAGWVAAFAACVLLAAAAQAQTPACERSGVALRDVHWRFKAPPHPLLGQVLKGGQPIAVTSGSCTRSPLQQLIAEVWDVIRGHGIVLLGEVHDNPEHHLVREDIMWPRLEPWLATVDLRPAAVFEHIRTSQQAQLDHFYDMAGRSRRLWQAYDLLRELDWTSSGWPAAEIFEPLFDGALWAKLPIHAGNAPRERTRALARGDLAGLTPTEQARLDIARTMPEPLLGALAGELEASHCGVMPASAFGAMSLAQRYTDAHLAASLVEAADKQGAAFLLAGNGHVRSDRGVPWYLRQFAPGRKVAAVMLLEVEEGKVDAPAYVPRAPDGAWAADYVLFTPRHPRADPCEKMRQGKR